MKRSRILHLLRYLWQMSDEAHPLSSREIAAYLSEQGFAVHRTTIGGDMELLEEIGVDIVTVRSSPNKYYICQRPLEAHELHMLVDAVLSSKFITEKKSEELIIKIGSLTSRHIAKGLCLDTEIGRNIKPVNERIYYTIDTIREAIVSKHKMTFLYLEYTPKKELRYKNDGYRYTVSPYTTFWRDDHYYLLAHSEKHGKVITFRIDRMDSAKLCEMPTLPPPDGFDGTLYGNRTFEMFDGEVQTVELKCKNDLMDVIVDKFGEDVLTTTLDAEHFKALAQVYVSPRFYGWLFGFMGAIEIVSPPEVRDEYIGIAKRIAEG